MTDFKVGDRVRLSAAADYYRRNGYNGKFGVGDKHGTVVETNGYGRVDVAWDGGELDHWNYPPISEVELVETEYDRATVDALVAHLRAKGMFEIPNRVEEAFEEMTAPKTHKVVVEFEVEDGEDITTILDRTDIDYTIKED